MKFTVEEFLAKLPLPPNDKWKDGVWFIEPFKKGKIKLELFTMKMSFTLSCAEAAR